MTRRKPTVYLLWAVGTRRFKIGYTAGSVDVRAAQIAAMSPLPLRIVAERAGDVALERALHAELRRFRLHGEWFSLPEQAVWRVLEQFGIGREQVHAAASH